MPPTLPTLLTQLRNAPRFIRNVTAWQTLPACDATTAPWPPLDERLIATGQTQGIMRPYNHQAQAIQAALDGYNTVMASGTASGKTLGYTLPVLNSLLHDPTATALLIFPTKALAHDQLTALLHIYRGVFGSHVANVLRRLRRIARFYGAEPRLIAASATIANPQPLAESLWEAPVIPIEQDGTPYGTRHILFYNPPLLNPTLGLRASAAAAAIHLAIKLLHADVQTIIFARARITVELILRDLRARVAHTLFSPDAVQGYRGGYLPNERRAIERGLRAGDVRIVVATNALELGIDIGALDAAILVGYPGSIASTRQQMGRAGRHAGTSLAVLIATPAPLDQYLVAHPEYFFGRSPETARVAPDTLSLLATHLTCAAFELPFAADESFGTFSQTGDLLTALADEGIIHQSQGRNTFTWVGDTYPAQAVSLRTALPDNIVVKSTGGGVLGTVDRPSAPNLVHEGAVYFHAASAYHIESLDWEQGLALARPAELDYYTIAASGSKVEQLAVRRTSAASTHQLTDEEVRVHTKTTAYRRVHHGTHATLGWGEIDLPEQLLETEGFRLTLAATVVEALAEQGVLVAPLDYGPDWPTIRKKILARDRHQCRVCGTAAQSGHSLEVHHLTPLRNFLRRYTRTVALKLAHAPDNLIALCPACHRQIARARGAHTALGGLAYLIKNLAPVFLMCDPHDLGTSIERRDAVSKQPAIIIYDAVPGGVGLSPSLLDLWSQLARAAQERVTQCGCTQGCPSCVGPAGENEPGAKDATRRLLGMVV